MRLSHARDYPDARPSRTIGGMKQQPDSWLYPAIAAWFFLLLIVGLMAPEYAAHAFMLPMYLAVLSLVVVHVVAWVGDRLERR